MKTLIVAAAVVSVLAMGAFAYAGGYGSWGGGHMMGPGYGGHMTGQGYGWHMMSQGYGGHMRGWGSPTTVDGRTFHDETRDSRREIHEKRFGNTEPPRTATRGFGGYGNCF